MEVFPSQIATYFYSSSKIPYIFVNRFIFNLCVSFGQFSKFKCLFLALLSSYFSLSCYKIPTVLHSLLKMTISVNGLWPSWRTGLYSLISVSPMYSIHVCYRRSPVVSRTEHIVSVNQIGINYKA